MSPTQQPEARRAPFAVRGVLEGFYDRLWTWDERTRVAEFASRHHYTAYVYAPKEDPGRNAGWRTTAVEEHRALESFADACHRVGLELWAGLRPLGVDVKSRSDVDRVASRLSDDLAAGADRLLILADDLPGDDARSARSEALGAAHAALVTGVLDRLGIDRSRLAFCPTDYAGSGSPYLRALGRLLPPEVDVCWTGRDVVVSTITSAEAEAISRVLRRAPLVWDNYPVNDAGMVGELHIGPLRGREGMLGEHVRGPLVNAALQPEATLVPIATAGDYLDDPAAYDADASFARALADVAGNARDAAVVATLAAAVDRSAMRHGWTAPSPEAVREAVARVPLLRNRRLAADLAAFVRAV